MSIADLEIQLTIQAAHAEVPGFEEASDVSQRENCGHPVPRIGWIKGVYSKSSHPPAPPGWCITSQPTAPAIYLCDGHYMVRDQQTGEEA